MREVEILALVPENKRAAAKELIAREERLHTPLIIRIILLAGAWISAGCLLFGSGLLFYGFLGWLGAVMAVAAWMLNRVSAGKYGAGSVFASQFALVLGLAGKGALLYAVAQHWNTASASFWICAAGAAVSYPLFKNPADRFAMCALAVSAFFGWMHDLYRFSVAGWEMWSVCMFLAGLGILMARRSEWRPLGYAVLSSCLTLFALAAEPYWNSSAAALFNGVGAANIFLGAALAAIYLFTERKRTYRTAVIAALVMGLSAVTNLGVMMGAALMLCGFLLRERVAEYVGTGALAAGLVVLYYFSPGTLLIKSGCLLLSGFLVLCARYALIRGTHAQ